MSFKINPLYLSDGYKTAHKAMLAPETTKLYGTWIPRSLKYGPKGSTKITSFGQQMTWKYIHDAFDDNFFKLSWQDAQVFVSDMHLYLGLPYDGSHFRQLHELGYLPIRVKSLPEGIETVPNIPHMTFINTVDGFAWLTLYLETIISALAWKPSTSATIALQYRRNVEKWVNKTAPAQSFLIPYLCHDFSARGLNPHDMISSGLGHATSFRGSDTLAVIPAARYYYNEPSNEVVINSVNASEHSVSTTKIFTVGEQKMLEDWLETFPTGILSVVSDTFDLWKLITEYLPNLKNQILARDGKLVIRPDSGDPVDIVCGINIPDITDDIFVITDWKTSKEKSHQFIYDKEVWNFYPEQYRELIEEYGSDNISQLIHSINRDIHDAANRGGGFIEPSKVLISESEQKGVIELLWDIFGGTVNEQGFKVLDSHIGAIYGDSINLERQVAIYERLAAKGFAATNIVLGVGLT